MKADKNEKKQSRHQKVSVTAIKSAKSVIGILRVSSKCLRSARRVGKGLYYGKSVWFPRHVSRLLSVVCYSLRLGLVWVMASFFGESQGTEVSLTHRSSCGWIQPTEHRTPNTDMAEHKTQQTPRHLVTSLFFVSFYAFLIVVLCFCIPMFTTI